MADDQDLLKQGFQNLAQGQLHITTTLQQHGELLAQIHQMLSPPEVKKDEVSLRDMIGNLATMLERHGLMLEAIEAHLGIEPTSTSDRE